MSTSMARTAGMRLFAMTAMLTIFMTAICTTCTGIMLTSISSRSAPRTPCTAPPKSGAQATSTVRTADTKPPGNGDHLDYLVNGRLHHTHGDHCDDHGPVQLV